MLLKIEKKRWRKCVDKILRISVSDDSNSKSHGCVCMCDCRVHTKQKRGLEIGKSHKIEDKKSAADVQKYVDSCMCKSRQAA